MSASGASNEGPYGGLAAPAASGEGQRPEIARPRGAARPPVRAMPRLAPQRGAKRSGGLRAIGVRGVPGRHCAPPG